MATTAKTSMCNASHRRSVVVFLGNKNFPAGVYIGRNLIFILPVSPAGDWIVTALLLAVAELHGCSPGRASSNH